MTLRSRFGSKKGMIEYFLHLLRWRFYAVNYPNAPKATQRVVFICHGNICRSALAKAVADKLSLNAESYGLYTSKDKPAHPRMQTVAANYGYSLDQHRTQTIDSFKLIDGDLILVMDLKQYHAIKSLYGKHAPVSLLGLWASSSRAYLHDPYSCGEAYFDTCTQLIEDAVINLNQAIKQQP